MHMAWDFHSVADFGSYETLSCSETLGLKRGLKQGVVCTPLCTRCRHAPRPPPQPPTHEVEPDEQAARGRLSALFVCGFLLARLRPRVALVCGTIPATPTPSPRWGTPHQTHPTLRAPCANLAPTLCGKQGGVATQIWGPDEPQYKHCFKNLAPTLARTLR